MYRVEGGPISRRKRRQILWWEKCNISQFVKKKNPGYRIIELFCYCFLTNLGILFLARNLNYLIKNVSLIQYKDIVQIYPYLISEGDEIVRACDRHRNETVTLTKHVTKYKYMRKWMVEFISISQSSVIKIAWVNSIRLT